MADDNLMRQMLEVATVIAVVGLSNRPDRPSHAVSAYMQAHGYRIVPVNPACAGQRLLDEVCYPSLEAAASALAGEGAKIDLVNVFRRGEDTPPIAREAVRIGASGLWLQLGVHSAEAQDIAGEAGVPFISDRCIKIDHARLRNQLRRN